MSCWFLLCCSLVSKDILDSCYEWTCLDLLKWFCFLIYPNKEAGCYFEMFTDGHQLLCFYSNQALSGSYYVEMCLVLLNLFHFVTYLSSTACCYFEVLRDWHRLYCLPPNKPFPSTVLCINVSGSIDFILLFDINNSFSLLLFRNVTGWMAVILLLFRKTLSNSKVFLNKSGSNEVIYFPYIYI